MTDSSKPETSDKNIGWDQVLHNLSTKLIEKRVKSPNEYQLQTGQGETIESSNFQSQKHTLIPVIPDDLQQQISYPNFTENDDSDTETIGEKIKSTSFNYKSNIRKNQRQQVRVKLEHLEKQLLLEKEENKIQTLQLNLGIADKIDFDRVLKAVPKTQDFFIAPQRKAAIETDTFNKLYSQLVVKATSEKRKYI